jgi:hypothetical protein
MNYKKVLWVTIPLLVVGGGILFLRRRNAAAVNTNVDTTKPSTATIVDKSTIAPLLEGVALVPPTTKPPTTTITTPTTIGGSGGIETTTNIFASTLQDAHFKPTPKTLQNMFSYTPSGYYSPEKQAERQSSIF